MHCIFAPHIPSSLLLVQFYQVSAPVGTWLVRLQDCRRLTGNMIA